MLVVVDEEEFNVNIIEEDINYLAADPYHGVLQTIKEVSLSYEATKQTFLSLKMKISRINNLEIRVMRMVRD